ncbi:MAG: hypothetical protein DSY46_02575, partial [Hydrogenimonas sp.]
YIVNKSTKYSIDEINCSLLHCFDLDFEQIVKLNPYEMDDIVSKKLDYLEEIEILRDLYDVFRKKFSYWLIEQLKITVCPYCNREYIFKIKNTKKDETKILATFDHFYSKSEYPYLAVSFYNLIPSCSICNSKFKHTKAFSIKTHIHPYIDDFNKLSKFKLQIEKSEFYYKKDGFHLELETYDERAKNSKSVFRLGELYQNHKDIVLELIQKSVIYNDSYIDELMSKYEGTLFKNREDLIRNITCGYVSDDDLHKRPLSKLVKDISEELNLI